MAPITLDEFEKAEVRGKETVDSEKVLEILESETAYTTSEIAEKLGVKNREAVLNKLKSLVKAGQAKNKKIGIAIFWLKA
jgi:predicted ArsR family transcriptional regulator